MPIFAPKKEETQKLPEKVPEVPTMEELREIAKKLSEWLRSREGKIPEKQEKEAVPVKELKEIAEKVEAQKPEEVKEEVERPPEIVVGPPLFIKLEKYHRILRHISELRRTLFMTKSTIATLAELERLREENVKLLKRTIERIDSRLADLDKELLRPKELPEEYPEEISEVGTVESALSDLKGQLKSLKEELESIA